MKYLSAIIGIMAFSIMIPSPAQAGPVGKFTSVEGRVDITRPGQAAKPVRLGDEVYVGDIVRAKSKAKAEVTFSDGNILRIARSTRVKISEYLLDGGRKSAILKLFRGKIQSKVRKLFGGLFGRKKRNRYEVHTPTSVCGVRGTNFFTYHQSGISGFIFKEGSGYGYSLNRPGDVKNIKAGQTMLVTSPDLSPVVRPSTNMEIQKIEGDTAPSEKSEEEKKEAEDDKDKGVEAEKKSENTEEGNDKKDAGESEEGKRDGSQKEGKEEPKAGEAHKGDEGPTGEGDRGDPGEGDVKGPGDTDEGRGDNRKSDHKPGEKGSGDHDPGDRKPEDRQHGDRGREVRGPEERGTGDREQGEGGPMNKGPGYQESGEHGRGDGDPRGQGQGDHGPRDRGPSKHGLDDNRPGNYGPGGNGPENHGPGDYGPGDRGPGDHRPSDYGPGDRGPGDHGPGNYGPGDRGPGDHRLSDYGPGDHGPGDYGPGNYGPGDHGPGNYGPGDRGPGDHGPGNYGPGDRGPGDYGPGNYGPGDHGPGDYGPGNYGPGDHGPGNYGPGDRGPGDHGPGNYGPGNYGPGDHGPGNYGPGDRGPGDYGPGNYGPGGHGPGDYGPGNYGPGNYGPGNHGPGDYGPGDHGPGDYGPGNYGPGNYGPGDYGPGGYGPGDYGPGDYGPGNYGPGDYGSGGPMPGDPGQLGPAPGDIGSFGAGLDDPGQWGPEPGSDPGLFYPSPEDPGSFISDTGDAVLPLEDTGDSGDFISDSSDPIDIPQDVPQDFVEPFTVTGIAMYGDLIGGYYYELAMAGTYACDPPFIHMSRGVQGKIKPGTGPLSEAYYRGFAGANWNDDYYDSVIGVAEFFYVAPDGSGGLLDGDIFGYYYPTYGTWEAWGNMYPIEMVSGGIPYDYPEIQPYELYMVSGIGTFNDTGGETISVDFSHGFLAGIVNQDWGMWRTEVGGTYTGTTSYDWAFKLKQTSISDSDWMVLRLSVVGDHWTNGEIDAEVTGGWVDLKNATTGILGGGLHGGYNPNDASKHWFAVSGGAWMETEKFLEMAGKIGSNPNLAALDRFDIPAIEVGRTYLYGSSGSMSVYMNDVIFFSYSTGGDPRLWATNSVGGSFSSTPPIDHTVPLNDGYGLSADFQVKRWDNGKWGAAVKNGSGFIMRSDPPYGTADVQFKGAAAGTYSGTTSGSFSGTAAGPAKKP